MQPTYLPHPITGSTLLLSMFKVLTAGQLTFFFLYARNHSVRIHRMTDKVNRNSNWTLVHTSTGFKFHPKDAV